MWTATYKERKMSDKTLTLEEIILDVVRHHDGQLITAMLVEIVQRQLTETNDDRSCIPVIGELIAQDKIVELDFVSAIANYKIRSLLFSTDTRLHHIKGMPGFNKLDFSELHVLLTDLSLFLENVPGGAELYDRVNKFLNYGHSEAE